jgi:hypothetical protein
MWELVAFSPEEKGTFSSDGVQAARISNEDNKQTVFGKVISIASANGLNRKISKDVMEITAIGKSGDVFILVFETAWSYGNVAI